MQVPGQQFQMFTKERIRSMEPVKEAMLPVNRLALEVLGWAALAALSFFFHLVAFIVVLLCLAYKASMFRFVYENTRIPDDPNPTEHPVRIIRYEESSVDEWEYTDGTATRT